MWLMDDRIDGSLCQMRMTMMPNHLLMRCWITAFYDWRDGNHRKHLIFWWTFFSYRSIPAVSAMFSSKFKSETSPKWYFPFDIILIAGLRAQVISKRSDQHQSPLHDECFGSAFRKISLSILTIPWNDAKEWVADIKLLIISQSFIQNLVSMRKNCRYCGWLA